MQEFIYDRKYYTTKKMAERAREYLEEGIWPCKDNWYIDEMSDTHLINAIHYCKNNNIIYRDEFLELLEEEYDKRNLKEKEQQKIIDLF